MQLLRADGTEITRICNVPEVDINLSKIESVNALSPDVSHKKKILLLRRIERNLIKSIPCQTILFWRLVAYTLGASGF